MSPAQRIKAVELQADVSVGNCAPIQTGGETDSKIGHDEKMLQIASATSVDGLEHPASQEKSLKSAEEEQSPPHKELRESIQEADLVQGEGQAVNADTDELLAGGTMPSPAPEKSPFKAHPSSAPQEENNVKGANSQIPDPATDNSRDDSSEGEEVARTPPPLSHRPLVIFSPPESNVGTPIGNHAAMEPQPTPTMNLFALDSPQIGTTLLRRESLRRKESPRKRGRPRSPQKKQLKKRDTLQEREILQRFSEETSPEKSSSNEGQAEQNKSEPVLLIPSHDQDGEPVQATDEEQTVSDNSQQTELRIGEAILESHDLQRAVEAIEVCEDSTSSKSPTPQQHENTHQALQEANSAIAQAEMEEAQHTISEVCEKADLPVRKTRSGARFSDDTSMLKDFLSRAQARKAAKVPSLSPKVPKSLQISPKRSPKTKTGSASQSSHSEPVLKRGSKMAKSSPQKPILELTFEDDIGDETTIVADPEPMSCRRSTRTRLPAPPKTPTSGPSLIPVRRADGADPKVLPKSQAQELAIITRANTRRNKGQSKPPLMALKELPADEADVAAETERSVSGKAVAWAETLASYQGAREVPEEAEEQRPKIKRLRGLAAVNGTPAAKKSVATSSSNGTPAPKRRGKVVN